MATRKPKRFNGQFGSDVDAANETDDPIGALNKSRGWTDTEEAPAKKQSFKEAFAAARGAGDKTFEWNGKKFTTEVAKPKAAAPATPKAESKYETPYDRSRREDREAGRDFDSLVGKLKSKFTSDDTRKPLPLKGTKSETGNKFMGSTGLKSGGSVKGWGQARGARKAKMY
jgi:hypothetical protein